MHRDCRKPTLVRRGLLASALLLALSPSVYADATKDKDEARSLMQSGLKLFNDKDYLGALATFKSAYKQFASSKILLNIGTTQRQLGRNAEAANTYQRYLQALDSDPTKRADVEKVLAELDATVAVVTLASEPAAALVTVNTDEPWVVSTATAWRITAGNYKISATLDGYEPLSLTGTVRVGQAKSITLTMVALPEAPQVIDPSTTTTSEAISRYGAMVRTHIDVSNRGAAVLVGGFYDVVDRVAVQAAGIVGPTFGAYLGTSVAVLTGKVRPLVSLGVPVFFSNGARVAVRAAVGVYLRLGNHLSLFAEAGAEYQFNPEADITKTTFIPALGILGRL